MIILRKVIISLIILLTISANSICAFNDRIVFSGEDLLGLGVNRPTDIFKLLPTWRSTTVDGYTWWASASGLESYDTQGWVVLLDGHKLDYEVLGVQQINNLPIDFSRIDSVEIFNSPTLVEGIYASAGAIHFHTKAPAPKRWAYNGSLVRGQETGDPGAFRYTTDFDTNVDKLGPDFYNFVENNSHWGCYSFANVIRDHFVTDVNILERNLQSNYNVYPKIEYSGNIISAKYSDQFASFDFQLNFTDTDDFFPYTPSHYDLPSDNKFGHAGLIVTRKTPWGKLIARGHFSTYQVYTDTSKNSRLYDIDWSVVDLRANLEHQYQKRNYRNTTGIDIPLWDMTGGIGYLEEHNHNWREYEIIKDQNGFLNRYPARLYSQSNFRFSDDLAQEFYFDIKDSDLPEFSFHSSTIKAIDDRNKIKLKLYYQRKSYYTENSVWASLMNNSYYFNKYSLNRYKNDRYDKLSAELHFTRDLKIFDRFNAGLFLRSFNNMLISNFNNNPTSPSFFETDLRKVDAYSSGFYLNFEFSTENKFHHRLDFSYIKWFANGDTPSKFEEIPERKFSYSLHQKVGKSFVLGTAITHISGSKWQTPYQSGDLPSYSFVDLILRKSLLGERLNLRMIFRNAIDEAPQTHINGSEFDFSVFFQANLNFNSNLNLPSLKSPKRKY